MLICLRTLLSAGHLEQAFVVSYTYPRPPRAVVVAKSAVLVRSLETKKEQERDAWQEASLGFDDVVVDSS